MAPSATWRRPGTSNTVSALRAGSFQGEEPAVPQDQYPKTMTWPTDERRRDTAIVLMLAAALAILLAGGALVVNDYLGLKSAHHRELTTAGNILATTAARALSEQSEEAASQALEVLRGEESVVYASVYLPRGGSPLASYFRTGAPAAQIPDITQPGVHQAEGSLLLIRNVTLNGTVVGMLAVRVDTRDVGPLAQRDLSMAALLLITAALITLLLVLRLRQLGMNLQEGTARLPHSVTTDVAVETVMPPPAPRTATFVKDEHAVAELQAALDEALAKLRDREVSVANCQALLEEQSSRHAAALEAAQAELAAVGKRADEASRSRVRFLMALTELLRTRVYELAGSTYSLFALSPVHDSTQAPLRALDDLVDFLRLESGAATIARDEISIWEALYDATRMVADACQEKGLELQLEIHPDVPRTVIGDRGRFRVILGKLLDNAVSATEQGSITIAVTTLFRSETTVGIHIQVRDTGRGLAPALFAQAVNPLGDAQSDALPLAGPAAPNTGLGLAIASRVAALMGGTLWMESEPGQGSVFHFTANFEPARPGSAGQTADLIQGARILVADADPVTRRPLQHMMTQWQVKPALATSGRDVIEMLRSAASARHPFDLVLADCEMTGTGGGDLATEIREHPELGSPVVLVLIPLNRVSVIELARRVRYSRYLVKPVTPGSLLAALNDALQVRHAGDSLI